MKRHLWIRGVLAGMVALAACLAASKDFMTDHDWYSVWLAGGSGEWMSLARQDVRDDLGLTEAQQSTIERMVKSFCAEVDSMTLNAPDTIADDLLKHRDVYEKKAKELIGKEKYDRLIQIHWQMLGSTAALVTFFQDKLGFNSNQVALAKQASARYDDGLAQLSERMMREMVPVAEVRQECEKLEAQLTKECDQILTPAQGETAKKLQGKHFDMKQSPIWWRLTRR